MIKFISAIIASIRQGARTALDKIMGMGASLIQLPLQVFGFGTSGSPLPAQPPEFRSPVATDDLFANLFSEPAPTSRVHDLDREGVNSVFKLAKMSKADREIADLSAVKRDDVRALLISMTQAELIALTKAGPSPVRKLLIGGDAQVWGVPSVKSENIMPPLETELAMKLRAVKAAMAKPKGSVPFKMPQM